MKCRVAAFFVTLSVLLAFGSSAGWPAQPNVILVMTDDQGYGDFGCHGNPIVKTPHLDRLHGESIRLVDFHVEPMCTPTRGQLLTGVHCLRNGAMNVSSGRTFLRREFPTLGNLFGSAGYATGVFGKWHLGDNYPYRPQDRGFQESVWYPSSHIGSAPDHWNNDYFDDVYTHNGARKKFEGYTTDVFFNEALRWMKGCISQSKPFFCYIPTAAAHGPLFVPAKYREPFEKQGLKPNVARFFGMIANIDENMGRLETFLREAGIRDNTLVIFLTDNGGTAGVQTFNAGMRGSKITLYEGGHRVPCFIRWPAGKLRSPGDVAGLTAVQDIAPTLVELCGLPTERSRLVGHGSNVPADAGSVGHGSGPLKFDGLSLAAILRGTAEPSADRMVVAQFSRMQKPVPVSGDACVMWQRWRLVEDRELYDLASDPAQEKNVLDAHPEIAAKLRGHYARWWSEVAPRVNEHSALIIGSDAENPMQLSPADWEDSFFDQGQQVRNGLKRNGAWNIIVERAGAYEFELRRWAREADAPFSAALPAMQHADGQFIAGTALPVSRVRLKVGTADEAQNVARTDKQATFTISLPAGRARLQTWLIDEQGQEIAGAYYVYIRRK